MEAQIQLITVTMPGNVHTACEELTRLGLADMLVTVAATTETATILVLRAHDEIAPKVRAQLGWPEPANMPYYRYDADERWTPPRHRS